MSYLDRDFQSSIMTRQKDLVSKDQESFAIFQDFDNFRSNIKKQFKDTDKRYIPNIPKESPIKQIQQRSSSIGTTLAEQI